MSKLILAFLILSVLGTAGCATSKYNSKTTNLNNNATGTIRQQQTDIRQLR